ncbi:MAG: DUF3616 domain-containing protein [Cyanothece sp. SIO1E1]|nr:DUF3616 domain-containing protein [Cyanothece sp. SIO1E1]
MPILPQTIEFSGKVHKDQDLSAIANFEIDGKTYLAIGSDESKQNVQLLKQVSDQVYDVDDDLEIKLPVAEDPKDEIDIESITFDNNSNCLYIAGSHSRKRKTVKIGDETAGINRDRLADIKSEKHRNRIFQVNLKPRTGKVKGEIEISKDLKDVLTRDPYLKAFVDIPSKENGVDIEGLAIQADHLFLGFRGPVLRGNHVPVMVTKFDHLEDYEIRFVQLDGNGIRDMTAVKDGFLIISGPIGDAPGPYKLYFWDGTDMVYGIDRQPPMPPALISLEDINAPIGEDGSQGKAEGITVLEETAVGYRALIIYDSLKNGSPQLWHIHKP